MFIGFTKLPAQYAVVAKVVELHFKGFLPCFQSLITDVFCSITKKSFFFPNFVWPAKGFAIIEI